MSTIRRQSIISSGIMYFGFGLGFLNTLLFTKWFTPAQYGLIGIFMAIGTIMYSIANLGMPTFVSKFYPYYKDNLEVEKNDLITLALGICFFGFLAVTVAGLVFKTQVIGMFEDKSAEIVKYYTWIFPFGFGLTFYTLLETFAWQVKQSVLTNYLREVQFRATTLVLILLSVAGILTSFDIFIKIYAFSYVLLAVILLVYLVRTRNLNFVFSLSRVTRKYSKKIKSLVVMVWSGTLVYNVSFFFAQIVIAMVVPGGLAFVGIYTLAVYIGSLIQAPQRGVISAAMGPLAQAWKDKDYGRINRIYRRSSINQLIFSVGMFVLIWINFKDGVITFHLKKDYLDARMVFLFIGLTRIVDMGTGLNTQIITTSTFWRFDFFTGLTLAFLTLPLNYIMAKEMGMIGPAIADLITFSIYNGIRYGFLYRRFNMQPFTIKTLLTLLLGLAGYFICQFLFAGLHGLLGLVVRSTGFCLFYATGVLTLHLSEDVLPVWITAKKKISYLCGRFTGRNKDEINE